MKTSLISRVLHIGYVENGELAALYRCATVAAIPTLFAYATRIAAPVDSTSASRSAEPR